MMEPSWITNTVGTCRCLFTALDEVNNALKHVTKYKEGYAYYPIRIKHFGSSKSLAAGGYDTGMVTWNSASHSQKDRYDGTAMKNSLAAMVFSVTTGTTSVSIQSLV